MKLSINHVVVRWAYLFSTRPNQTSLCELFWRSTVLSPFVLLIVIAFIWVWGPGWLYVKYGQKPFNAWLQRRRQRADEKFWVQFKDEESSLPPDPSTLSLLWLGLVAIKKFCPIITFYGDE